MECLVYKSSRKAGVYLFVATAESLDSLPTALLDQLGQLHWVMALDLTKRKTLAIADPATVLNSIESQGFYLQLPPGSGTDLC
ncbi:MAG: hypothetical protein CL395_07025 [Acidiferrobacteraceae bacterium]|nr:hypothetical protein [Acidiferrobacteraceae bacterium]MCP4828440.1 YcgL domain-containing protein [Pseudomonadota bacterium]HJP08272.1 YcgL domain-containing protein [Arenicellales bacterium]